MPRKSVPARYDWALENAGDDLRPERERAETEIAQSTHEHDMTVFEAFVCVASSRVEILGINPCFDQVYPDGWRQIDYEQDWNGDGELTIATVWLPPTLANLFAPDLDIPF